MRVLPVLAVVGILELAGGIILGKLMSGTGPNE